MLLYDTILYFIILYYMLINDDITASRSSHEATDAPDLPTKITPAKIRRLIISRKFPMDMGIPPLEMKTLLE